MCSPVVVVASVEELAERFVARCEQAAAAAIAARGRFAWVIPAGSAAERLLPRLARASVVKTPVLLRPPSGAMANK